MRGAKQCQWRGRRRGAAVVAVHIKRSLSGADCRLQARAAGIESAAVASMHISCEAAVNDVQLPECWFQEVFSRHVTIRERHLNNVCMCNSGSQAASAGGRHSRCSCHALTEALAIMLSFYSLL